MAWTKEISEDLTRRVVDAHPARNCFICHFISSPLCLARKKASIAQSGLYPHAIISVCVCHWRPLWGQQHMWSVQLPAGKSSRASLPCVSIKCAVTPMIFAYVMSRNSAAAAMNSTSSSSFDGWMMMDGNYTTGASLGRWMVAGLVTTIKNANTACYRCELDNNTVMAISFGSGTNWGTSLLKSTVRRQL